MARGKATYFCTPKGAKVIGWAGVEGIHYCFVRSFGEMAFAVSPLNTPGNYVQPVDRDFMELKTDSWVTVEGTLFIGKHIYNNVAYDDPQISVTKITPAEEVKGYVSPY